MKLNLGCGIDYRDGFINVDKLINIKRDLYADFEKPYCLKSIEDDSVDEVIIFDVLEHIVNLMQFMGEVWRVCKHNAKVYITVPYWSHYLAVIDPTHIRFFHEGTFQFFSKDFYVSQKILKTQASQIPIDFDFKIDKIEYILNDNYKDINKEELRLLKETQINVIQKLYVTLIANKGD